MPLLTTGDLLTTVACVVAVQTRASAIFLFLTHCYLLRCTDSGMTDYRLTICHFYSLIVTYLGARTALLIHCALPEEAARCTPHPAHGGTCESRTDCTAPFYPHNSFQLPLHSCAIPSNPQHNSFRSIAQPLPIHCTIPSDPQRNLFRSTAQFLSICSLASPKPNLTACLTHLACLADAGSNSAVARSARKRFGWSGGSDTCPG